jgi:cytochrome c-type biogenesis protein CcmH
MRRPTSATLRELLASRLAWAVLAAVVAAALAVGSVHPGVTSTEGRISYLDSVIKCPSCDDLSIAQSNASTAVALRAVVAADVQAGQSNAQIENYVVARYGSSILLEPRDALVWVVPLVGIGVVLAVTATVFWRRRRRPVLLAGDEELVAAALTERRADMPPPAEAPAAEEVHAS